MTWLQKYRGLLPLLFVSAIALGVLLVLALRGLDLGFFGDLLAYEYHYQQLGIRGGMNWLIMQHWQRHLLAALYSVPIHLFFPAQSAAWYASALVTQFASGFGLMLFLDGLLRGRWRWLAAAAALVFVFSTLYVSDSFEFPTNSVRNVASLLTFLSLWAYLQSLRTDSRAWYAFSLLTYVVAFMSYEQSALFFVIYPLLAYFEKRPAPSQWRNWFARVVIDLTPYAVFVLIYLFILVELFPSGSSFVLSPAYIVRQLVDGLNLLFNPLKLWDRAAPVLQGGALLLTAALAVGIFVVLAWGFAQEKRAKADAVKLLLVGMALVFANLLSVAPTTWTVIDNPRLLFLSVAGEAVVLFGVVLGLVPARLLRGIVAGALAVVLVVPGIVQTFQLQGQYAQANDTRQSVLSALVAAVKLADAGVKPYLLLLSDAHPSRDLALNAQDINFPLMMDIAFATQGLAADALYFDVSPEQAPPADQPASAYGGPFIVVDAQGIYSPLRPGVAINPERLVIVYYNSVTQSARILDQLPQDILDRANIVQRVSIPWRTNFDLLASGR